MACEKWQIILKKGNSRAGCGRREAEQTTWSQGKQGCEAEEEKQEVLEEEGQGVWVQLRQVLAGEPALSRVRKVVGLQGVKDREGQEEGLKIL